MPWILTASYWVLAFIYIIFASDVTKALEPLVKILPLLFLVLWFCKGVGSARAEESNFPSNKIRHLTVIIALGFSMLGDVILAVDGQHWFVYGLLAFLISHCCYIAALAPFRRLNLLLSAQLISFYLMFASGVLWLMAAKLGAMLLPVSCYILIILLMSASTWHSQKRNNWLVMGGILFICSDAAIGLNRFYVSVQGAGVFIMLSYYAAQYALIRGFKLAESQTH